MNLAFQVSEDDIENVLFSNPDRVLYSTDTSLTELAHEIFPMLDFQSIEDAALYGDTLSEQTDFAYDEIAAQLIKLQVIPK